MGCVQIIKPWRDWVIHCERLESGALMFWADKTFRNMFERIAWENGQ